jgi:hypothetical protein
MRRLLKVVAAVGILQWALLTGYAAGRTIGWHGTALQCVQFSGLLAVVVVLGQLIRLSFQPAGDPRPDRRWLLRYFLAYALVLMAWEPFSTLHLIGGLNLVGAACLLVPALAAMVWLLWTGEWLGAACVALFFSEAVAILTYNGRHSDTGVGFLTSWAD